MNPVSEEILRKLLDMGNSIIPVNLPGREFLPPVTQVTPPDEPDLEMELTANLSSRKSVGDFVQAFEEAAIHELFKKIPRSEETLEALTPVLFEYFLTLFMNGFLLSHRVMLSVVIPSAFAEQRAKLEKAERRKAKSSKRRN